MPAKPRPNVRYVVRWKDAHGKDHAYQREVYTGTGKLAIDMPAECPWPPEHWHQVVVEFSPPGKP